MSTALDVTEPDEEDEIVKMGAKKGRKKASDRVKVIDKELIEVQKKESGVEVLMSVGKKKALTDNCQMTEMEVQIAGLQQRRIKLLQKRHKLLVFIAQADGNLH
jgi:hypothetical protein